MKTQFNAFAEELLENNDRNAAHLIRTWCALSSWIEI